MGLFLLHSTVVHCLSFSVPSLLGSYIPCFWFLLLFISWILVLSLSPPLQSSLFPFLLFTIPIPSSVSWFLILNRQLQLTVLVFSLIIQKPFCLISFLLLSNILIFFLLLIGGQSTTFSVNWNKKNIFSLSTSHTTLFWFLYPPSLYSSSVSSYLVCLFLARKIEQS